MSDEFRILNIGDIIPNPLQPRKRFDDDKLAELADSITEHGVLQPIIVRPMPASRAAYGATFEIVAGERRYRASLMAGLTSIPAIIKNLTDMEALEVQVLENLARADLSAVEEAYGYAAMLDAGASVAQIAQKMGKSDSYIRSKTRLLDLCHEVLEAVQNGALEATVGLLIARIPVKNLQIEAFNRLRPTDTYAGASAREAAALIRRDYTLRLDAAKFDKTDIKLVSDAPSCTHCLTRTYTGTNPDPDLLTDPKLDLCLNPTCYKSKTIAAQKARVQAAAEAGATVLDGSDAKRIMPSAFTTRLEGHLRLDDPADSPVGIPLRSIIADVMQSHHVKEVLIVPDEGDAVACLPTETVDQLLRLAAQDGGEVAKDAQQKTDEQRQQELKEELQTQYELDWRVSVLMRIWQTPPPEPRAHPTLSRWAASQMLTRYGFIQADIITKYLVPALALPKIGPRDTLKDMANDLQNADRLVWVLLATHDIDSANPAALHDIASLHGIDVDNICQSAQQFTAETLKKRLSKNQEKAVLPLTPAAHANGVRGERSKRNNPKTSASDASAAIAAALSSLDDTKQRPTDDGKEDAEQRPTDENNEASPLPDRDLPQPEHTPQTAENEAKPKGGKSLAAYFQSGMFIKHLPTGSRGKIIKRIKKTGSVAYCVLTGAGFQEWPHAEVEAITS